MIVTVTFDVDTDNKATAYMVVSRIFASLCLPEKIKTLIITYPEQGK
jgi:hypothetical protein